MKTEMEVIEETLATNCPAHLAASTLNARRNALASALGALANSYRGLCESRGDSRKLVDAKMATILQVLSSCSESVASEQ